MEKSIDWNGIKLTGSVSLETDYIFKDVTFTENGNYSSTLYQCDGFENVTVAVPIPEYHSGVLNITENGTYKASDYDYDGFSEVTTNINTSFLQGVKSVVKTTCDIQIVIPS